MAAKRTNQIDRTRNAIVEAAIELVFEAQDPSEFTMQNVADTAGVSHRTLYRYFESRQELIDAAGKRFDERLEAEVPVDVVRSFEHWTSSADQVIAFGAAHRELLRRTMALSAQTGEWRSDRDRKYWELFRERFAHLDDDTAREDFAVLRHVLGAINAILIGSRFKLDTEATARAIDRSVAALVDDIARRDREAADREGGS